MQEQATGRVGPPPRDMREARQSSTEYWHSFEWAKAWIATGLIPDHMRISLVALADALDRTEGHIWTAQLKMANAWGIKLRTFEAHLKALEDIGVIQRSGRRKKGGSWTSGLIHLYAPPSAVQVADGTDRRPGSGRSESPSAVEVAVTVRRPGSGQPTSISPLSTDSPPASSVGPDGQDSFSVTRGGDDLEGMRDCNCDAPRLGRHERDGRRWCYSCGGYELTAECDVCARERPGGWLRGRWRCYDCLGLEEGAVAVEGVAADPVQVGDQDEEAPAADVERRVDGFEDSAGAFAEGDGLDTFERWHGGEYKPPSPYDDDGIPF